MKDLTKIYVTLDNKSIEVAATLINDKTIVNCMKHEAVLIINNKEVLLRPSGIEARVETIDNDNIIYGEQLLDMPTIIRPQSNKIVVGLPNSEENVLYYVNMITFAEAVKAGRSDVIMGDSSGTELRYTIGDTFNGHVIENTSDRGYGLMKAVTHLTASWQTKEFHKLILKEIIETEFVWAMYPENITIDHITANTIDIDYDGIMYEFTYNNLDVKPFTIDEV